MNNGQVAGYVNFYHALDQARAKSVAELTHEIDSYERRAEESDILPALKGCSLLLATPRFARSGAS